MTWQFGYVNIDIQAGTSNIILEEKYMLTNEDLTAISGIFKEQFKEQFKEELAAEGVVVEIPEE